MNTFVNPAAASEPGCVRLTMDLAMTPNEVEGLAVALDNLGWNWVAAEILNELAETTGGTP